MGFAATTNSSMSTRLEQLQKMLEKQPNDSFLLYGIAMEYKKSDQLDDALKMLSKVSEVDPGHGYAWFQAGQIQESRGDLAAAKSAYQAGIVAAAKSGDSHARSELEGALSMIE
jgi:tetratricopeptide (TPR) repeat protein